MLALFLPTVSATYTGKIAFNFSEMSALSGYLLSTGASASPTASSGQLYSYYLNFSDVSGATYKGRQNNASIWSYPFPAISVGSSAFTVVTLVNNGNQALRVQQGGLSGDLQALCGGIACPTGDFLNVDAGSSLQFVIAYTPTVPGSVSENWIIIDQTPGSPTQNGWLSLISFSGTGELTAGKINTSVLSYAFPSATVGQAELQLITVTNDTNAPIGSPAVSINPNVGPFSIAGSSCGAGIIAMGASCGITVQYAPTLVAASDSAVLTVDFNGVVPAIQIPLSGRSL